MSEQAKIIGGGLLGRLIAYELAKKKFSVEVFDTGNSEGKKSAAYVAAAMLAPLAESPITEPSVVQMGLYSLPRWHALIGELSSDVLFEQNGTLILWHRQDESEAKRFSKLLEKSVLENSQLSPAKKITKEEIKQLEPSINSFQNGLFLPNEGQLDNRELLNALVIESEKLGVNFHWNKHIDVTNFSKDKNWVIDCRGLGAKEDWNQLRGVRGEVIRLHAPEVKITRPTRLIHPKYPIYIAPKKNNIFVIGATEIESEDMSDISVRSTLELLSAAYTVHSGFAEARILETGVQCRPTLKNNLPFVDIKGQFIKINGLYRHGFMISPAILDATVNWMTEGSSTLFEHLHIEHAISS